MSAKKKTAVIELTLNPNNASKSRTKAMQLAATIANVESINLRGENLDELVVRGKEIDATELTVLLRKKLGGARLVDYAPTYEDNDRLIMERYRRLSYRPDSYRGRCIFPGSHNCRSAYYPDPYNYRNGYPDPYSYNSGFPHPYDYRSDYSDWRRYDQPRIDLETYPLEQIEYVSYYDD